METKMFFRKMFLTTPVILMVSIFLFPHNHEILFINFIFMAFFFVTWMMTKDHES